MIEPNLRGPGRYGPARYLALVGFIVVCYGAGFVGTLFGNTSFYGRIERPSWAPPASLFGPVWGVLYTLMGIAGWLVWRTAPSRVRKQALTTFVLQLVLNALWTPAFFGLQNIGLALAVIAAMVVAIGATTWLFWKLSRPASVMFVPYLSWVSFAAALNFALWRLND